MKWVRFEYGGVVRWGVLRGQAVMATLLTSAEVFSGQQPEPGPTFDLAAVKLLPPVERPGKIVSIGQNYWDHVREQGKQPPDRPIIFAKYPTTIIGPGETIRWSPALTQKVDFEAELAAVIGRVARRVSEADALSYVFGYTAANDVTARDLQYGDGQWVRGKSLDTFCPLGPAIATADEIPDPQQVAIRCEVNGVVMQDSSTAEMIFNVAHLVSYASQAFTLEPGDLILTGTPNGVGHFRTPPVYLQPGDRVVVELAGIGRLENVCAEG